MGGATSRAEDGTDWREAIITHGGQTAFGLIWGVSSYIISPAFFWWLSPVLVGLVLSIPLSIVLSKESLGRQARKIGLLLTPEETQPPYELRRLTQNLSECYKHMRPIESLRADYGLLQAVLDPYINAVHVSMLRQRRPSEESREWFSLLRHRLLSEGPDQLTPKEKLALLLDAESMICPARGTLASAGGLAGRVVAIGHAPIQRPYGRSHHCTLPISAAPLLQASLASSAFARAKADSSAASRSPTSSKPF